MTSIFLGIEKVLILSPHPDDEALGCGGTLLTLKDRGVSSSIIYITNGERLYGEASEEVARKRIEEAHNACRLLGVRDHKFLGLPDGSVKNNKELLLEKLEQIVQNEKPDLVFSPSPIDYHQDHIATANVSIELWRDLRSFKLVFYEIYNTINFNYLVEITELIDKKKGIIMSYHTSLYGKPEVYVHALLGLNAHRSLFTQKKGFYEAFTIITSIEDSINIQRE